MNISLNSVFLVLLFVNLVIVSIGLSTLIYLVSQTYNTSKVVSEQTNEIDNLALSIHNDTKALLNRILSQQMEKGQGK